MTFSVESCEECPLDYDNGVSCRHPGSHQTCSRWNFPGTYPYEWRPDCPLAKEPLTIVFKPKGEENP